MENPTFGFQIVLLICAYVMTVVPLVGWITTGSQQGAGYREYIEAGFITHVAFGFGVGVGSLLVWAFKGVTATLFGWWG